MNNKVLVRLFIPEIDYTFDIFIPVNELIWKIKKLIVKSVTDLTGGSLNISSDYTLINKLTSKTYDNNATVINTDIRNATELLLLSVKENNVSMIKVNPENALDSSNQNNVVSNTNDNQNLNPSIAPIIGNIPIRPQN